MSDFTRKQFTSNDLRALSRQKTTWVISHPTLGKYLQLAGSRQFTIVQIMAILQTVLGETFLKHLLDNNATVTLGVARAILDDHMREGDLTQKDLQVNLVVNCVARVTRAQNLLPAQQFGYGEEIIRKGLFPPEFKLRIKEMLFDQGALQTPALIITHVQSNMRD